MEKIVHYFLGNMMDQVVLLLKLAQLYLVLLFELVWYALLGVRPDVLLDWFGFVYHYIHPKHISGTNNNK